MLYYIYYVYIVKAIQHKARLKFYFSRVNMQQKKDISLDQTRDGHTTKKFRCPGCGKKRFVKYYDYDKSEYLPDEFGRCDRQEHCGYFKQPWTELTEHTKEEHAAAQKNKPRPIAETQKANQVKQVPREVARKTLTHFDKNNFIIWLTQIVGPEIVQEAQSKYFIGTAKENGTIFWQIDKFMRIRTGQKIIYLTDGHRDKNKPPKRLFTKGDGYSPCLFGEHLFYTIGDKMPVAIVESEKTAVIASIYLPSINGKQVLWMAAGGANGLTDEKIKILSGREVILCPDFSYHARATWGRLPMRKAPNDKGILIPDPNGEPDENFIPYSQRLKKAGAIVRFFDPYPQINDSSDIADFLINLEPPKFYNKPDFDKLILPQDGQETKNTPESIRIGANLEKNGGNDAIPLDGIIPFRLAKNDNGDILDILVNPKEHKSRIAEFIQKPQLQRLIKELSIFEGEIMPLTDEF